MDELLMSLQHEIKRVEDRLARLKNPTSADQLRDALAARHADDVFVAECKDGPTHTASHKRLDAWVLKKTWSPVTTIGYEIKVSRSDWLRDQKLVAYLPLCHYLYVVAPPGIVELDELHDGIGLMEPVGENLRLVTRKRAVWRDVELPANLLVYILMCRTKVIDERSFEDRNWKLEELRKWSAEKDDRRRLSYAVSAKIRSSFEAQESRQRELDARVQNLLHIEKRMLELGFDPTQPVDTWKVKDKLRDLAGMINTEAVTLIERTERTLSNLRERLSNLNKD